MTIELRKKIKSLRGKSGEWRGRKDSPVEFLKLLLRFSSYVSVYILMIKDNWFRIIPAFKAFDTNGSSWGVWYVTVCRNSNDSTLR